MPETGSSRHDHTRLGTGCVSAYTQRTPDLIQVGGDVLTYSKYFQRSCLSVLVYLRSATKKETLRNPKNVVKRHDG